MIHNNNYLMKRIQVQTYMYGVYIYVYINPLKFDHYYFITDGSLCLLYRIHSNATITMSMVWLNFDLLLFHKILSSSNQCNQSIIIVLNSLLIVLPEMAP
jgi:hypothetical protein